MKKLKHYLHHEKSYLKSKKKYLQLVMKHMSENEDFDIPEQPDEGSVFHPSFVQEIVDLKKFFKAKKKSLIVDHEIVLDELKKASGSSENSASNQAIGPMTPSSSENKENNPNNLL
jgi:hypothetical protein